MASVVNSPLLSDISEQANTDKSTHYVHRPNFNMEIGNRPDMFNFIRQGAVLTSELVSQARSYGLV